LSLLPKFDSEDPARRRFLIQCCQAAGAFLASPALTVAAPPNFHLHPRYREQTALDTALLQISPALDVFACEEHHDKLAAILDSWSKGLRQSPQNLAVLEQSLSETFRATSWQPIETIPLRPASPTISVQRLTFAPNPALAAAEFLSQLKSSLAAFSEIQTADFQITAVTPALATEVRYELVGTGADFHQVQRTGTWSLQWEFLPQTGYRLTRWQAHTETRARATHAIYTDITSAAFGSNQSYQAQLLPGADHWRTVLDGACGIDIYGHNGVSVADVDNDGHDDVYICQAAGLPNLLFRNRGNGTFEDITESAGVGVLENTACALFADFSNSGRQDLVVVRAGGPLLFINQGDGKFRLKPGAFQFANPPQGTFTGAAAADYNRDGRLDIYFCLYTYYQGADQYKYPTPYFAAENGPPNFLMHNNGDGTFRDVTAATGLNQNNTRFSFCCGWSDYNRDGWPDLYVVNDFGRKNLYRNNADGTFTDIAAEAGVEDIGAGMSVCWLDYDNDGAEDLYVANMWTAAGERLSQDQSFQPATAQPIQALYRKHAMGNSLFHNQAGSFHNATAESQTALGRWAWSSDAWDFDHDGYADIYVANGMISGSVSPDLNSFFWRQVVAKSPATAQSSLDYEQGWNAVNELIREDYSWSGYERNCLFANNHDGTFTDIAGALGIDFTEDSRSFALADFDGDGRQELLLKNRNGPQIRLLKNTWPGLPPAIAFRLQGTKSNRDAIGAVLTIETSLGWQTKLLQAGSGFLAQHSKELFFGLGAASGVIKATIHWPSGLTQHFTDLPANHQVWLTEASDHPRLQPFKTPLTLPDLASPAAKPKAIHTWLLAPILAPAIQPGKAQLLTIDGTTEPEQAAIYNLLFRHIFDYHQDLPLPTSFLIDENAQIAKIYQGPVDARTVADDLQNIPRTNADRLARALPFPGLTSTFTYGRNYLSLGSIFFQHGYPEPAEDFFKSALKDDPTSAEAYYGLGSVYLKQQKNSQALDCFERVTSLKSSYPETTPNAWNNLGLLATRSGEIGKAIGYFEQAIQLDRDHFIALENLGSAYRQQKRYPEARQALERALAIKPQDPEANYNLGMVFAQADDTSKAYEYLTKALAARPNYPEALNNLGILYLRTHRREEAVTTFEKCIQIAPTFDQSYMNLARIYAIEGNRDKSQAILRALLAQLPDDARAQQALNDLSKR